MNPNDARFIYRGCSFICSVEQIAPDGFQPHVLYEHGLPTVEQIALPSDAEPYGSAAEAHRHAQQQAMRWVHDRTGGGQGQF